MILLYVFFFVCSTRVLSQPIQLLKPAKDHSGFEIVQDGIKALREIQAPLAVISAAGNIHTGKSFLLNRVIGVDKGFPVGYSVEPETSGLWFWKTPLKVQVETFDIRDNVGQTLRRKRVWIDSELNEDLTTDELISPMDYRNKARWDKVNLIVLDMEGFHGPNVSKDYDSMLYAITAHLSSELVFTTLKMIDSRDLEYLETITKQANLFKLRSNTSGGDVAPFLDALTATKLTILVQDFVQDLGSSTPAEWCEKLFSSKRRTNNMHDDVQNNNTSSTYSSFKLLFSSIDCVTLPAPSWKTDVLQRLDQYDSTFLNYDYTNKFHSFRTQLLQRSAASPKIFSLNTQKPMSGSQLADILSFLLDAAQLFPASAALNNQFVMMQAALLKTDLTDFYRDQMMQLADQKPPPLIEEIARMDLKLRERLSNGWNEQLGSDMGDAFDDFNNSLDSIKSEVLKKSQGRVEEHCVNIGIVHLRRLTSELTIEVYPKLPMLGFQEWVEEYKVKTLREYESAIDSRHEKAVLMNYPTESVVEVKNVGDMPEKSPLKKVDIGDTQQLGRMPVLRKEEGSNNNNTNSNNNKSGYGFSCADKMEEHRLHLQNAFEELANANLKAVKTVLARGQEYAVKLFQATLANPDNASQVEQERGEFEKLAKTWKNDAMDRCIKQIGEELLRSLGYTGNAFRTRLRDELDNQELKAYEQWKSICIERGNEIIKRWEKMYKSVVLQNLKLPLEEDMLARRTTKFTVEAETEIGKLFCAKHPVGADLRHQLIRVLTKEANKIEELNVSELTVLVKLPLKAIKEQLVSQCKDYYFWEYFGFSLIDYIITPFHSVAQKHGLATLRKNEGSSPPLSENITNRVVAKWIETELKPTCRLAILQRWWGYLSSFCYALAVPLFLFISITLGPCAAIAGLICFLIAMYLSPVLSFIFKRLSLGVKLMTLIP